MIAFVLLKDKKNCNSDLIYSPYPPTLFAP